MTPWLRCIAVLGWCLSLTAGGCLPYPGGAWTEEEEAEEGDPDNKSDLDGDGHWGFDDCDEADPTVYVGAVETPYDGIDQDCDGHDLTDVDGDGHDSWVLGGSDCHDSDATIYTGAPELCDGIDNDCDGEPEADTDADGDGHRWCEDCHDGDPTIFVGSSGALHVPGEYATMQDAFSAAVPGDVICVGAGTHLGTVSVPVIEPLMITAVGGGLAVIDGQDTGPALRIANGQGESVVVRGFTITNGWAGRGGGVQVIGGASPTLEQLTIVGNRADDGGGGVSIGANCNPVLRDVVIEDNESAYQGGGMFVTGVGLFDAREPYPVLERVTIRRNVAGSIGGGVAMVGGRVAMVDVVIEDNAAFYGGGLHADHGHPTFDGLVVRDNAAGRGGGMFFEQPSGAWIASATIEGNEADEWGGGLYVSSGSIDIVATRLVANAAGGRAGGVYLNGVDRADLDGVAILGNTTVMQGKGGGLALFNGSTATIRHGVIAGNECLVGGEGGGIYASETTLEIDGSILTGNDAAGSGSGSGHEIWATYLSDTIHHSDLWGWESGDYVGIDDPVGVDGNVDLDPVFLDASSTAATGWDLHLDAASPLIDAGDSAVLDPDGGPSDIGIYTGKFAGDWDLDRDGYSLWWQPGPYDEEAYPSAGWDCDDTDASVTPVDGC